MADLTQVQLPNGVTYDIKDNTKLPTSGGTMTGAISLAGTDVNLQTSGTSSDDSGDIVWYYGNGQEKARLWTNNEYSSAVGLNYRVYTKDGTNVYDGTVPLTDTNTTYTLSTSGNNVVLTPSSGSANTITVPYATSAGSATDSTKLPIAGGTMTGALIPNGGINFTGTGLPPFAGSPPFYLGIEAFDDGGQVKWQFANNCSVGYANSAGSAGSAAPTSGSTYYIQNNVGSSRATTTSGSWMSMLNSSQTGSPTLPTSSQWWTVLSADCWSSAPYNWTSQLAIATQDTNGVWWRRNDSGGTSIDSSTWHRLAEGDSSGNASVANKLGTSTVGGTTTPVYLNAGTPTALSYTIAKSVPSDAVFTDTNNAVTQTATNSTNANYEVLFSGTADNTTRTEGARKATGLTYNPDTSTLTSGIIRAAHLRPQDNDTYKIDFTSGAIVANTLNGVTIGSSPKFTDTTYSAGTGISLSGTTISSKIWEGTQAQYDALSSKPADTIYYITDGSPVGTSIANLDDVTITSPQTDDQLYYSNGTWYNAGAKVKQVEGATSANQYYEVLFSENIDTTTRTGSVQKSSGITYCDYETLYHAPVLKVNGVVDCQKMSVRDISSLYTVTKSSGNWVFNSLEAYRCGNVIHLSVVLKGNGSAVSSGSNGFVGTLSGGPLPVTSTRLGTYYSGVPLFLNIETDGAINARVTASNATISTTGTPMFAGTFITND